MLRVQFFVRRVWGPKSSGVQKCKLYVCCFHRDNAEVISEHAGERGENVLPWHRCVCMQK